MSGYAVRLASGGYVTRGVVSGLSQWPTADEAAAWLAAAQTTAPTPVVLVGAEVVPVCTVPGCWCSSAHSR